MELFFSAGACSLAPHIVLKETQLSFKLEKVDTGTHKTEHGLDYYTINPAVREAMKAEGLLA
ncbi:hypothetical protein LP414_32740 [Polaromonas sp. P1(28)-13]|nr:hypothetical protein LP414_32740 [Polaromonas sp. P1(28)-13]